jgi:hypothetical protein
MTKNDSWFHAMTQKSHRRFVLSLASLIIIFEIPRTGRGRDIPPQAKYPTILPQPDDLPRRSEIDELVNSMIR